MERSLMPDNMPPAQNPVRLLPSAMPATASPSPGDWRDRGLCVGGDPDTFFPSRGDPGALAREICAACRVRDDCLAYSTEADEHGIWGGLDQDERRNLGRRQRRKETAARAEAGQAGGAA
jgi:WhiB family redox-sensing transcriptional regulator